MHPRIRPKSLPFPTIWNTFLSKDPDTGLLVDYEIKDLTEEYFDIACDQVEKFYLREEPASAAINFIEDEESVKAELDRYREVFSEKLSIACFRKGSSELIGFHALHHIHKDDPDDQNPKGRAWSFIRTCNDYTFRMANIFEKYGVDWIIGELGLVVQPKYRSLGVATELFKARIKVTEALGLRVTTGGFTSAASIRAALKAGYVDDLSLTYDQLAEMGWNYGPIEEKYYKIMSAIVK